MDNQDNRPRSYEDFFVRPQRWMPPGSVDEYLQDIRPVGKITPTDKKIEQLYTDCFSHHVVTSFKAGENLLPLATPDPKRLIAQDNISGVFVKKYYQPPTIYVSDGIDCKPSEATVISLAEFAHLATANPITSTDFDRLDIGSNRVSYLLGEQGEGKSILISKLIAHISTNQVDADGYTLVPIYFDFESLWKEGNRLKDIDDRFYCKLLNLTYFEISGDRSLADRANLGPVEIPSFTETTVPLHSIHHLRFLLRHLAERKIRLLYIFDNLDGYHFFYTKYSFFRMFSDQLADCVLRNTSSLIWEFSKLADLGLSGVCALVVSRRNVFKYLQLYTGLNPREETASVFTIGDLPGSEVVSPRIDIHADALEAIKPILTAIVEHRMEEMIAHMRGFLTVKDLPTRFRSAAYKKSVFEALRSLGHHGHRSVIRFLDGLRLRYKDSDVLSRLLDKQPSLLLLLYILNGNKRFSQKSGHFPNLFLNDCTVSRSREFPDPHKTHVHTYWLKYFMLKYISRHKNCTGQDIYNLFHRIGGYEEHLVLLALGSLCMTNESRCVAIGYSGSSTDPLTWLLNTTARGEFLVKEIGRIFGHVEPDVEFCFSFTYLQLVTEDLWLALPKEWKQKIFTDTNYEYIYYKDQEYGRATVKLLQSKAPAVLHFVRVLKASLNAEKRVREPLFDKLDGLRLIPDIDKVGESAISAIGTLYKAMNRDNDFKDLLDIWDRIKEDKMIDEFFRTYYDLKPLVDPNA